MRQARRRCHLCGAVAAAGGVGSINHCDKRLWLEVTEATLRCKRGGNDWITVEGLAKEPLRFQHQLVQMMIWFVLMSCGDPWWWALVSSQIPGPSSVWQYAEVFQECSHFRTISGKSEFYQMLCSSEERMHVIFLQQTEALEPLLRLYRAERCGVFAVASARNMREDAEKERKWLKRFEKRPCKVMTMTYIFKCKKVQKPLSLRNKIKCLISTSVSLHWVWLMMQNRINKIWPTLQVWNFQQLVCQSGRVGMQRPQECMKVHKMWINKRQICLADVNRWGIRKEPQRYLFLCQRVQLVPNVNTDAYCWHHFKVGYIPVG